MNTQKELGTIAMLQARLDRGQDYFELFVPLALACIAEFSPEDMLGTRELQGKMEQLFGVRISTDACKLLLNKSARKGAVRKAGGTYLRCDDFDHASHDCRDAWKELKDTHRLLGDEFSKYLREEYGKEVEPDTAADAIIEFIEHRQVPLLLDENLDKALGQIERARGKDRKIARFILKMGDESPEIRLVVSGLLQGVVMKQALLLEDVTHSAMRFRRLSFYIDSPILMALLHL